MATVSKVFIKRKMNDSKVTTMGVYIPLLVLLAKVKLVINTKYSIITSVRLSENGDGSTQLGIARTLLFMAVITLVPSTLVVTFPTRATQVLNSSRRLLPVIASCLL